MPGQDAAYRAYLTTTGKKLFQEMMAANANLLTWSSARTMYQGTEHGSDFDYVGASVYAGPPPEPGTNVDAALHEGRRNVAGGPGQEARDDADRLSGTEVLRQQRGAHRRPAS